MVVVLKVSQTPLFIAFHHTNSAFIAPLELSLETPNSLLWHKMCIKLHPRSEGNLSKYLSMTSHRRRHADTMTRVWFAVRDPGGATTHLHPGTCWQLPGGLRRTFEEKGSTKNSTILISSLTLNVGNACIHPPPPHPIKRWGWGALPDTPTLP